jgi:hypothetical protein
MMIQRDSYSQAVVSSDVQALNKYKQERALHRKVNSLHKDVENIKELLNTLCDRLDRLDQTENE